MKNKKIDQLSTLMENRSAGSILNEVKRICSFHYDRSVLKKLRLAYKVTENLYLGKINGYRQCNTEYHDFEHVQDVLMATVRLIDGYNIANPAIDAGLASDLIIAAIIHDTGYIQESWDMAGTGAKYTTNHVQRSVDFLKNNFSHLRIQETDVDRIGRIILATDYANKFEDIPYGSDEERCAGLILGTSDLVGQMSSRVYLEKLLFLYYEFREAGIPGFNTEYDIIYKTMDFYDLTMKRLKNTYEAIYRFFINHFQIRFGIDLNLYMNAIENSMAYLKSIIEDDKTNFRHKLKRGDWVNDDRDRRNPSAPF